MNEEADGEIFFTKNMKKSPNVKYRRRDPCSEDFYEISSSIASCSPKDDAFKHEHVFIHLHTTTFPSLSSCSPFWAILISNTQHLFTIYNDEITKILDK